MIDHDQSKFVDFHHYEQRIATLEAKQRMVHVSDAAAGVE